MTNPSNYPREANVILYRKGTAGTITYRDRTDTDNKLIDYEFQCPENRKKVLTVWIDIGNTTPASNLLSSSCTLWSNAVTGALQEGDYIRFGLYQSDGSTVDVLFKGVIKNLEQSSGTVLQITAWDPSARLDETKVSTTLYTNMRKKIEFGVTWDYGYPMVDSVSDASIQNPMVEVKVGLEGIAYTFGSGVASTERDLCGDPLFRVAQPFIASGDLLWALSVWYSCSNFSTGGVPDSFRVMLVPDNGNAPASEAYVIKQWDVQAASANETNTQAIITPSPVNNRCWLVEGEKYWLVFKALATGGARAFNIEAEQPGTDQLGSYSYHDLVSYSIITDSQLKMTMTCTLFEVQEPSDYIFDDTNDEIVLTKTGHFKWWATGMAILTYYYNTITLEDVCKGLIKLNTGLLQDVNANLDYTMKTYSTKGKSIGDCLRELMDIFETSGTFSGRQHVMAHYEDGSSIPRLKIGKRLDTTNDSETVIASDPDDRPSNPDEWIIVGTPSLKKTTRMKYSKVTVVGKRWEDDYPIIVTVSDRAKTGSFWEKMDGLTETLIVVDDNLQTLEDCYREAYRMLDAVLKDVWEGTITLSGQHNALFDFDNTSSSFGSGKILKLYWGELGISAVKMKVTQIILRRTNTEITVNDVDVELLNRITQSLGRLDKSESFLASVGDVKTTYLETYAGITIADAGTTTMYLYDTAGALITNCLPRDCVKTESSSYNLKTFHAEFERHHGETNTKVRYIKFYNGAVLRATIDLTRTVNNIDIDEAVDKYRGNRLVVEASFKIA